MYTLFIALFALLLTLLPRAALAHCPLCTAGAVAVGLGAYKLGMSTASVGVGIGAFAVALGLWIAKLVPRQYLPGQSALIVLLSFASTVLPVMPFLPGARGLYIPFIGEYGTALAIPHVLIGSIIGGLLVLAAPSISQLIRSMRRGRKFPFQSMAVIAALLLVAVAAIEFGL